MDTVLPASYPSDEYCRSLMYVQHSTGYTKNHKLSILLAHVIKSELFHHTFSGKLALVNKWYRFMANAL